MTWNTYGDLLKPASIGCMRLKNRICMAPMDFKYFTGNSFDSTLTYRHAKVFEARAKGGCGLIFTCAVQAEREVMPYPYDMQFPLIDRDERIKEFAEAADMVHVYGAKIGCELTMGSGRYYDTPQPGIDAIAPSECQTQYDPSLRAREMTKAEIANMIRTYTAAAGRLKRAGFDCLLVMGQGGYLINQFLSPAWNRRGDEYGGSPEKRMRFLVETLEAVRAEVGEGYPVILGVNMDDLLPDGVAPYAGVTVDYQIEVARELERRGLVDAYQLRIGNYYDQSNIVPSCYHDNAPYVENFARFKAGVQKPCIFENRLDDPAVMQGMLERGEADFFSMGRMWIANPDLAERYGRELPRRQCLRCNYCLHTLWEGKGAKCAVNAELGHEFEGGVSLACEKKRVVVVGAGPGGIEAALTAARRGHEVILLERGREVGGKLGIVAAPSYKKQYLAYRDYLRFELERSRVKVRLGVEATLSSVAALEPDAVIVAVGAEPIVPPVPGLATALERGFAHLADTVLDGGEKVAGTVAVIGGGLVGCETVSVLTAAGCACHLVEMRPEVLLDASYVTRDEQLATLAATGAQVHAGTRLAGVGEGSIDVEVAGADGVWEPARIACDAVVLAVGYRPVSDLADELRVVVPEVYQIGDAVRARKIAAAVEEGHVVAAGL